MVKGKEREVVEWRERYEKEVEGFRNEIEKKEDFYREKIKNHTTEMKEKDGLIRSLTKELEEEDLADNVEGNPFLATSGGESEDGSLFDELGGEMARSFSMCPSNFKNLAKHLKKHVKVLEAKIQTVKSENKTLLDEK